MTMSNDPSTFGTGWSVSGQTETAKVTTAGQIEDGTTVSFRTQFGQAGTIWLPRTSYSAENVREAINQQALTMDAVHMLNG